MTPRRPLVIGVDVGGTNTDSVLLDLSLPGADAVLASHKAATTANVTSGVQTTLHCLLDKVAALPFSSSSFMDDKSSHLSSSSVSRTDVTALAVGTTHFLNALLERDASRVEKVAVLRLAAHGFADGCPPFSEWPAPLKRIVCGHSAVIQGGVNIDGSQLAPLDRNGVKEQARLIKAKGLRNVVVVGIGSPMDERWHQEETVKDILLDELGGDEFMHHNIVCSKTVAGKGLLARENAAILNASILSFARRTIRALVRGMRTVGLRCPLYLTSNAGHLLPFSEAVRFPIRIFSSGPTNSMRGAAFLAGRDVVRAEGGGGGCIVVDIGGTTSDVGFLLKNGYPRLSRTWTHFAGVKVNLEMPSVDSAGLGGGSILHIFNENGEEAVAVGPESVGHELTREALCFGGHTPTASDVAVAAGADIGQTHSVDIPKNAVSKVQERITKTLEMLVDRIKMSPDPCIAILVGGGSILCPPALRGVSDIVFPAHAGVANAIGAAMAKIYGSAETTITRGESVEGALRRLRGTATEDAVRRGGDRRDVTVLSEEDSWVPYADGQRKLRAEVALAANHVKVFGEMVEAGFDSGGQGELDDKEEEHAETKRSEFSSDSDEEASLRVLETITPEDLEMYRPDITADGRWNLSLLDVKFIEIGCYMLGCGGGGSPYGAYLNLRTLLSRGGTVSIMRTEDLGDDDVLPPIAGIGTPEVGLERPGGLGILHSLQEMAKLKAVTYTQMLSTEIGGSNGLGTLVWGSSDHYNIPTVDGDLMGRAWPNFEMVSQYIGAHSINELLPVTMCSGTGQSCVIPENREDVASVSMEIRRVCAEMGFAAGATGNPISGAKMRAVGIPNTFSLSWHLGRAVFKAQRATALSSVANAVVAAASGPRSARCLFRGKIRLVSTDITATAHSVGKMTIEPLRDDDVEVEGPGDRDVWTEVVIPYMNENLAVIGKGEVEKETVLATVPDLIFLLNQDTGENIGVQEYKYGLKVMVMVMAPHPVWTTDRGLEVVGPRAFGLPYEYKSPLVYTKPESVIDKFRPCCLSCSP